MEHSLVAPASAAESSSALPPQAVSTSTLITIIALKTTRFIILSCSDHWL
jgi:hypothetical protein